MAEETATGSSEEFAIECDWTIEVHHEYRVGDSRDYAPIFLTLNATKLGGTSSEDRYYGVATICVESRLAIEDEWDGRDIIGGGRFAAPAVGRNVAFELVAGDDLETYTGPKSDGSIPVVLLLTADYSASGVFNFITSGDWAYWSWPKPCDSPHTSKWPSELTPLAARSTPERVIPVFFPRKEGIIARP